MTAPLGALKQPLSISKNLSTKDKLYTGLLRLRLDGYASLYRVFSGISRATVLTREELVELKTKIDALKQGILRWEAAGGGELLPDEDPSAKDAYRCEGGEQAAMTLQAIHDDIIMPAYSNLCAIISQYREKSLQANNPSSPTRPQPIVRTSNNGSNSSESGVRPALPVDGSDVAAARELTEDDEIRRFGVRARYWRLISHTYPDRMRLIYRSFLEHQRLQRQNEQERESAMSSLTTSVLPSPASLPTVLNSPQPLTSATCPIMVNGKGRPQPRRQRRASPARSFDDSEDTEEEDAAAAWPHFTLTQQTRIFIGWMVHLAVDASVGCCGCGRSVSADTLERVIDFARFVGGDATYTTTWASTSSYSSSARGAGSPFRAALHEGSQPAFAKAHRDILTRQMSDWFERMCKGQVSVFLRAVPGLGEPAVSAGTPAGVPAAVATAGRLLAEEFEDCEGLRAWVERMDAGDAAAIGYRDRERALVLHLVVHGGESAVASLRVRPSGWWAMGRTESDEGDEVGQTSIVPGWDGVVVANAGRVADKLVKEYLVGMLPPKFQSSSL